MIRWNVSPEIFELGPLAPRWYGVLFALAFVAGYLVVKRCFVLENKNLKALDPLLIRIIVGTVVGARLGHCLFYEPGFYLANPLEILFVWKGGLASHGAAIGVFIAIFLFARKYKQFSFSWVLDRICLAIPLGGALIRVGNFFNSEIIGKPTHLFWGVVFERIDSVARHPSQIYEALSYLAIFLFTWSLYRKKIPVQNGFFFGLALALIFSARFLIEFSKEAQVGFEEAWALNMGQWLSLPFIAIGLFLVFRLWGSRPQEKNRN
ncbi:MAG: prolipoprotein diacylglyceryl transferase [Bradymonadales bacterium]|nr:MAG: prolipoprotein diacylglyceryl transferase [Bradymonadales bacterium]